MEEECSQSWYLERGLAPETKAKTKETEGEGEKAGKEQGNDEYAGP
jgi:hypothetical protein